MSNKEDKQYGLILPKKQQISAPRPGNIFGDDNVSDEEDGTDWVKKALKAEGEKNKMKRQTKLNMQKALTEDPTIYQYDEVYDDIERTKALAKPARVEEKRPKYIGNLLKAAERRKKEQEHRIERMVQKEREAEGSMYADKESFVTSAYRAKLEEFKQLEEEEARLSRLEAIGDVTKQQDISGFYRHLYEQTVDNKEQVESVEPPKGDIKSSDKEPSLSSENVVLDKNVDTSEKELPKPKKNRQYRQRVIEEDDSESEVEETKGAAVEESNESPPETEKNEQPELGEPDKKKQKLSDNDVASNDIEKKTVNEDISDKKDKEKVVQNSDTKSVEQKSEGTEVTKPLPKKDRSLIWQKRTVGPVFEAALQRYYARKAARMSGT